MWFETPSRPLWRQCNASVASDVPVLKQNALNTYSAEQIHIVLDQFHEEMLSLMGTILEIGLCFENNYPVG